MDIKTQCKCGAILKANKELAGRRANCPKCGDAVLIPKPDSIRLTCSCKQIIQVTSSSAGKRVKCPTCKQPVDVPNTIGMLSPDVPSPVTANKNPVPRNAPMKLATPAIQFNDSVWDDLTESIETAEKFKEVKTVKHKPIPVANGYAASGGSNSFDYVQRGITFLYIGVLLLIAAVLSFVLAMLAKTTLLLIVSGLLVIASSLLSMIGRILCLTVPKQVGATALIYIAVGFDIMVLLATVSNMIPAMPNFKNLSELLSVLGTVVFVIFLRKLATYINSDDLVQLASKILILSGVLVVVMLMSVFFGMILLPVVVVIFLLACFYYFKLLSGMRLSLC